MGIRLSEAQQERAGPLKMLTGAWKHRQLLALMVRREITGRYRGSVGGLAWSLLTPIMMLAVYTFVFSVIFNARWGAGEPESRTGFAMLLFVGLFIHGFFSECLMRAPGLILANTNLVKKVVFPLEVLPLTVVGSALFNCGINALVLLLAMLVLSMPMPLTILLFPLILLPLFLLTLGVTWFLAAVGVYLRDISQLTGMLSTLLLFLAPVFYPQSALPPRYQPWLNLNPLTFFIESSREVLLQGRIPSWQAWISATAICMLIAWFGYWWFQRSRRGFADVL